MNVSPSKKALIAIVGFCTAIQSSEGFIPINQNVHSASPLGNKHEHYELTIMQMTPPFNNENPINNVTSSRNLFGIDDKSTLNADGKIETESRSTIKAIHSKGTIIPKIHVHQRSISPIEITGMDGRTKFRTTWAFDDPGEGQNKDVVEFDTFGYTSFSKYFLGETYAGSYQNEIQGKQAEEAIYKLIDRMKKIIAVDIGTDSNVPDIDITQTMEAFIFMFLHPRNEKKKETVRNFRNHLGKNLSSEAHPKVIRLFESLLLILVASTNDDAPTISSQSRELIIEHQDRQNDPSITEKAVEWLQNAKTLEEKKVYLDIIEFQARERKAYLDIIKIQAREREFQALVRNISLGTELIAKIAGSKTEEEKALYQRILSRIYPNEKSVEQRLSKLESSIRRMLTKMFSRIYPREKSVEQRLAKLESIRLMLTDQEYDSKRKEILSEL